MSRARLLAGIHHSPSWLNSLDHRAPAVTFVVAAAVTWIDHCLPYKARLYFSLALNYLFRTPKAYIGLWQWLLAKGLYFLMATAVYFLLLAPYQLIGRARRRRWFEPLPAPERIDLSAQRFL